MDSWSINLIYNILLLELVELELIHIIDHILLNHFVCKILICKLTRDYSCQINVMGGKVAYIMNENTQVKYKYKYIKRVLK